MDTKLKSISYSKTIKTLTFIIIILSALVAIVSGFYMAINSDYFSNDKFEDTYQFRRNYQGAIDDIVNFELDLVSEDFIKNTYTEKKLQISKLREYKIVKSRIDNRVNFLYYIKNLEDNSVKTNVSKSFSYLDEQFLSIYYLNSDLNSLTYDYRSYIYSSLNRFDEFSYEFRSAVKRDMTPGDEFYSDYKDFSQVKKYSTVLIAVLLVASIITLSGLLYLITRTGRSSKDSELELSIVDKLPFEIQFIILSSAIALWALFISSASDVDDIYRIAPILISTLSVLGSLGLILFLSVVRRIKDHSFFKNFIIYKLCSKCFAFLFNSIKRVLTFFINIFKMIISHFTNFTTKSMDFVIEAQNKTIFKSWLLGFMVAYIFINAMLVLLISETYGMLFIIFTLVFIGLNLKVIYVLYKFLNSLQKIIAASDSVSYANDLTTLDLDGISPSLHELALNIINIQSGIKRAVDKALKGEQMKTALITNVSHDLKTPLTSIITYVDLLKKEKFLGEDAKNYLDILDEKSYRLKTLIEDIIEVNKASTGNMSVDKEKVDFNELIIQSMGEYEHSIENSNLELKINIPTQATFIEADSKSMWRILDNLIENALKYSADNSRVYIDISQTDEFGLLTIKNMSKLSLDISPEQLTERFVRGDEARSTDGSGLGLSIAQSLTDLQGGNFELIIDGDLFKVIVSMPIWKS